MTKIIETVDLVYNDTRVFKRYYKYFLSDFKSALVLDHPTHNIKCQDLSKPLLFLYYSFINKTVPIEKLQENFE